MVTPEGATGRRRPKLSWRERFARGFRSSFEQELHRRGMAADLQVRKRDWVRGIVSLALAVALVAAVSAGLVVFLGVWARALFELLVFGWELLPW